MTQRLTCGERGPRSRTLPITAPPEAATLCLRLWRQTGSPCTSSLALSLLERSLVTRLTWGCMGSTPTRLPRKEVIQPQLPLRLPCYDFVPVTRPTLDGSLLAVAAPASGVASFHDVTGGVYKAREHIHRGMADPRLLATPPSWGRVAAPNLN